jgi:hypothetical protein
MMEVIVKYATNIYGGAGIAMGYELDYRGSIPGRRQQSVLFSRRSRPALGPTQPPIHSARGFFPGGKSNRGMKLTTYLPLLAESIMIKLHFPMRLHSVVLN